ncbi:hypothetical protein CsSME_00023233 [Camellia sinensis var. sinensis]
MPLHWQCIYQRPHPSWHMPQCQDDENHYCSTKLSPLCEEIPKAQSCCYFKLSYSFCQILSFKAKHNLCLFYLFFLLRYEKRHSNIPAHISPCFRVKEGDHVTIGQCRPLSKTVRFNVLKVIPAGSSGGGGKKAFAAM